LNGQLSHTLEHARDLDERILDRLDERDSVVGISRCHREASDLCVHPFNHGEAGSIIGRAVDS
jgi:hypothetical protein